MRDLPYSRSSDDDLWCYVGCGTLIALTREIAIICGKVAHVRVAEIGNQRRHDRIRARARLKIDQLLVGGDTELTGEVGRIGLAHAPRTVAHCTAQGERSPALDRPGAAHHLWCDCDARGQVVSLYHLIAGRCDLNQPCGATDRVPQPAKLRARLDKRFIAGVGRGTKLRLDVLNVGGTAPWWRPTP